MTTDSYDNTLEIYNFFRWKRLIIIWIPLYPQPPMLHVNMSHHK